MPNQIGMQNVNLEQQNNKLPKGWNELQSNYPKYFSTFLACKRCNKKAHCHCRCLKVDVACTLECPNKDEVTKNTSKGTHKSHCPTCLRIGTGKNRGISSHNFSDSIEVFCCASCEAFYAFWMSEGEEKIKKEMQCSGNVDQKGTCLNYWNCELTFIYMHEKFLNINKFMHKKSLKYAQIYTFTNYLSMQVKGQIFSYQNNNFSKKFV